MKYALLASGSKGNSFYLESQGVKILIDCGTTQRYLKDNLSNLSVELKDLDALLITHDHSDHTKQIRMFEGHKIYSPTHLSVRHKKVLPYEMFSIEHLTIFPIKTSHDAEETVGYVIDDCEHRLVYITDTGYIREKDFKHIKNADYYVLESNHDPAMLMKTSRPYAIKRRILSESGHLSNDQAADILEKVVGENTKEITLAHLSLEANTETLAYETVRNRITDKSIVINVGRQFEMIIGGGFNGKE